MAPEEKQKDPYVRETATICVAKLYDITPELMEDNGFLDILVLHEFKEYATEVDIEFVRKFVRATGRCAIKLDRAAERCIQCLLDLIQLRVNYVV